jgi:hypothetical protein
MLKSMSWILRLSLFTLVVLIIGNIVRWNGKTISDQVKTQIAHAERSETLTTAKEWTSRLARDAKKGIEKKTGLILQPILTKEEGNSDESKIPSSERQKLRALIRELNGSSARE